jgi:hypothetical protein
LSACCYKFVVTNPKEVPVNRIVIGFSLALLASAVACKRTYNDNAGVKHAGELRFNTSGPWKIEYSTPLGMKLFKEAISWIDEQPDSRAQPANCAYNVSDVYENAGFDGNVYKTYSNPLVLGMIDKAEAKGGKVLRFRTKSKADFIRVVNQELGGKIPLGAMIAGCENTTCDGTAGAGHIAMLGDVDANGYLQVYHNNWYRPDNEGGRWMPHMISRAHYNHGDKRQWMPTPWLKVIRNNPSNPDLITDVVAAYPSLHGIDDLDPFTYYGFIGIAGEMWNEIREGKLIRGTTGGGGGNSGGGSSACTSPDMSVFNGHGREVSFSHGEYSPRSKVDAQSPRKDGLTFKLGLSHSSTDNSNLAFSSPDNGKTLTGFRYNLSWDKFGKIPFHATWNCNRWVGTMGSEAATLTP